MIQVLRENKSDILSQEKMDIRKAGSYGGDLAESPQELSQPWVLAKTRQR